MIKTELLPSELWLTVVKFFMFFMLTNLTNYDILIKDRERNNANKQGDY